MDPNDAADVPHTSSSAGPPNYRTGIPELYPSAELVQEHPGQRGRWVIPPTPGGWSGVVVGEWELTASGWEDMHPNPETNYIAEGELHVESEGVTVVARKGDVVLVPAGHVGRYWAPTYARMIAFHGPNPAGVTTKINRHWTVES